MSNTAIRITSYDGPEKLEYGQAPEPTPGPGHVAIDVDYAGANYVELLFSRGFGEVPLPFVPGIEASGRIRSLGSGVDGFAIGERVAALTINLGGGYGQVAVTNAHLVVPLPAEFDSVTAAAVPSNTTTAFISLERTAHIREGESVLVHSAVGGLGSQFGQVARALGARRIVGVVGHEDKIAVARSWGYDEVWLRSDLADRDHAQFDIVVDPVGGPSRIASLPLLKLGGRLLAVGNAAQDEDQFVNSNTLWLEGKSVLGFNLGAFSAENPELVGTYLGRAIAAVAAGEVEVHVSRTAPLETASAVLAELETGTTRGKIVLDHSGTRAGR